MQVYLIQLFSPQKNSFMRFLSLLLCLQYFIWVYYEHAKTVMLTIKLLPTIFNLQKCYHPVSFICAWSMPLYKIKRKEKYSSIEAELSLLVYLLYLFMGVGKCPLPPPKSCVLLWPEPYVLFGSSSYSTVRHFFTGTQAFLTLIVQYA